MRCEHWVWMSASRLFPCDNVIRTLTDVIGMQANLFLYKLLATFGSYGLGFVFYASQFPERRWPGRFDFWGHRFPPANMWLWICMYVCMCMIAFCSKADSSSRPAVINYGMSLSLSVRCSSTSQSRPMLNFECGMVLVLGINDSGDNRTRAQRGPCVGIWRRRTQLVTTHAFL